MTNKPLKFGQPSQKNLKRLKRLKKQFFKSKTNERIKKAYPNLDRLLISNYFLLHISYLIIIICKFFNNYSFSFIIFKNINASRQLTQVNEISRFG